MTPGDPALDSALLRQRAEQLAQQSQTRLDQLSRQESDQLIHELQVHQIELELQNEELRRIMNELEYSRQQFYQLFNQAPVGYLVLDPIGIVRQANNTFCQMVNRLRSEVIDHPFSELMVEPDREMFLDRYRAFFRNPAGKNLEARLHRDSNGASGSATGGATFYARIEGEPNKFDGDQDNLLVTVSDINERKLADEALRLSEEKFRQLAENIHEVFWLRDTQSGKMIYISPMYEVVWGRPCQEIYDRPQSFTDNIIPEDKVRVSRAQLAMQEHGKPFNERYRIVRPDGEVRWIWARTFPVYGADGQIKRLAGIAEDITELACHQDSILKPLPVWAHSW